MVKSPDEVIEHKLDCCPLTGKALGDDDIVGVIRRQVFELPEPKSRIIEHRVYQYRSAPENQTIQAEFPEGIKGPVQYGHRFEGWLVYLSDFQLIPLNRIQKLCGDLYGYSLSDDTITKARKRCYENILRKACHNPSGFKFDEWKKQYDKIVNDGYSENPYRSLYQ